MGGFGEFGEFDPSITILRQPHQYRWVTLGMVRFSRVRVVVSVRVIVSFRVSIGIGCDLPISLLLPSYIPHLWPISLLQCFYQPI